MDDRYEECGRLGGFGIGWMLGDLEVVASLMSESGRN